MAGENSCDPCQALITGGLHGNKPTGAHAAEQIRRWRITKGTLVVIPRVNVPGPEIPAGKIGDGIISTPDVLPTFTALAGAKLPAGRKLDGYDQSAFLTGKSEKSARDRFFYHIRNELQAVRHNDWKLILPKSKLRYGYARDPKFPEAELYNLVKDIGESKNVTAERPEIVARLSAMAKEGPSLGKQVKKREQCPVYKCTDQPLK